MDTIKVGDRVRLLCSGGYTSAQRGDELTVAEVLEDVGVEAFVPGHGCPLFFTTDEYERVTDTPDVIVQPAHYSRWAVQPLDFIMANNLPFVVGNVIKYVMRYDAKNGLEDLQKARQYIDILIEQQKDASKQA